MWPGLTLCSITEQVHDDRALLDRLIDFEEVLAWHPSVLYCLFPAGTVLSNTNDDIETVVSKVETLSVSLRTITDQRESVVLEVVLGTRQCKLIILLMKTYKELLLRPVSTL